MSIKTSFSIKDLENLSGVKAHTIRIWERRYKLFEPIRTDTNIRTYDQENLKKILNVAVLNENGYKVSKIAELTEAELFRKVRELAVENKDTNHSINSFKLAMLNFDQQLFDNTYNQLLAQSSFRDVFLNVFLHLLEDIGFLWITRTITPAHEHFISTLIQQKILINIERVQNGVSDDPKTYILFLPSNEVHELGLLYIHFELLLKGKNSIYLGPSVPMESLADVQNVFEEVEFVSYFTVEPSPDKVTTYLDRLNEEILLNKNQKIHIVGRNAQNYDSGKNSFVKVHKDILSLINAI